MSTLSEPNTGNVTAPVSIKRTRVFAPLKLEQLMDYARGSHIHRVSMFVHIESAGMTVAFCMELVRKLGINGITRKRGGYYTLDPLWKPDWFVGRYTEQKRGYSVMSFELQLATLYYAIFDKKERKEKEFFDLCIRFNYLSKNRWKRNQTIEYF